MVKWIETTGRTEEDAISAALFQLGLERDDVSIEVIERAKAGFLGFGSNPAKVRVSYEVEEEGGKPRPIGYLQSGEILSSVWGEPKKEEKPEEPKQEEKPVPEGKEPTEPAAALEKSRPESAVAEPAAEERQAPPVQEARNFSEPVPENAEEEETILAARPEWKPARPVAQNPPEYREPRRSQGKRKAHSTGSRLREGDEVLIGQGGPQPESQAYHEPVLSPAAEDDEKANRIRDFLTGLMERMEVQAAPDIMITDEGNYKVTLQGENLGMIIGRRGETLDAIQQLTSYAVNHGQSKRVRVHVDAEGYRAKREEALRRLAVKTAAKVVRSRRNITLEPMNAYERRIIHTSLQSYPNVTTYSIGTEPNRRTVVAFAAGRQN